METIKDYNTFRALVKSIPFNEDIIGITSSKGNIFVATTGGVYKKCPHGKFKRILAKEKKKVE